MAAGKRIRTPWKHRWRRFRYTVLPFLFFAGFTILTARLWERQVLPTQAIGEVEAVRVPVAANVDGKLAEPSSADPPGPPERHWMFGDLIEKGQVVATLEGDLIEAQAETINARVIELEEQLGAVSEQARIDQADRNYDYNREQTRLTLQHQGLVVQGLQLDVQISFDELDAQRLKTRLEYWEEANRRRGVTPVAQQTIAETRLELAAILKRIEENTQTRKEVARQAAEALSRVEAYPESVTTTELEELLAPVKAQANTELARLNELREQTKSLVIRSPIGGTVIDVFAWPGQNIQHGQPIIEVAATQGRYILGYITEDKTIRPEPSMTVEVSSRNSGGARLKSVVQDVGPQVVPLPPHLLRDPNRQEWGLPVKIRVPPQLDARPGESIYITFDPRNQSG